MDPNTTAIKLAAIDIQTELKKVAKKSPRLPENASLQAFNVEGYRYVSEGSTLLAPRFERRTADRPSH